MTSINGCSGQAEHQPDETAGGRMLRVALTSADLEHVRVAAQPAPMLELRTLLREPLLTAPAVAAADGRAQLDLARSLVAQPCAPGFLLPATADADDAIETVASTRREAIRRDLEDNVTAGYPLPGWTADLTRTGQAGTRARHGLQAALAHVLATWIEPRTRWAAPMVAARTRAWRSVLAARGPQAMLNVLHTGIRYRGSVLEVDLHSGANVAAAAAGAGIRVVPTLAETPSASLSSDGHAPIVLVCPVPLAAGSLPVPGPLSDQALDELIGPSRSMLLSTIAAGPGQGTRELGRRTGLAPASVSEHAQVLRRAGLTEAIPQGTRVTHQLTALGWALLLRSAGSA
jgi:DNA-binding transcriptional ArsR family regulator